MKRAHTSDASESVARKKPHLTQALADLHIANGQQFSPSAVQASAAALEGGSPMAPASSIFGGMPRESNMFLGIPSASPTYAASPLELSTALNMDRALARPLLSSENANCAKDLDEPVSQNLNETLVDMLTEEIGGDDAGDTHCEPVATSEAHPREQVPEVSSRALVLYKAPMQPRNLAALLPLRARDTAGSQSSADLWLQYAQNDAKRRLTDLPLIPHQPQHLMICPPVVSPLREEATTSAPSVVVAKWITDDEAMDVET